MQACADTYTVHAGVDAGSHMGSIHAGRHIGFETQFVGAMHQQHPFTVTKSENDRIALREVRCAVPGHLLKSTCHHNVDGGVSDLQLPAYPARLGRVPVVKQRYVQVESR
ncbi:hypothetical protein D3C78_1452680 [compost metagenome]